MDDAILVRIHARGRLELALRWERGEAAGPFHGAFVPRDEEAGLAARMSALPADLHGAVRLVTVEDGTFVVLASGETASSLTPFPLRRVGRVFHPADAVPTPFLPRSDGSARLGQVREGRVEWVECDLEKAGRIESLFRLEAAVTPIEPLPASRATDRPGPFPTFQPETLPSAGRVESEERRKLEEAPESRPSFWARLFGKAAPSKGEWEGFKQAPGAGWMLASALGAGLFRRLFDRNSSLLDRLARVFERGELETALRHAIPIDNDLVTALKGRHLVATDWRLPENLVEFSMKLFGGRGAAASIPTGADQVARLAALYRKAAEELSARGRHRQAAYVYAYLLKEFRRAAQELERGGFALEAAALVREKAGDAKVAAEILERSGYALEAVAIHLELKAFERAVSVCEAAGLREEGERCFDRWVASLRESRRRIEAGDLLWRRRGRSEEARGLYREEMAVSAAARGRAAARLVSLDYETGGDGRSTWEKCDAFLRSRCDGSEPLSITGRAWLEFLREVEEWARAHPFGEAERLALRAASRDALFEAVRRAQAGGERTMREDAVALLTRVLGDLPDPLAVEDLRRGLTREVTGSRETGPRASRTGPAAGIAVLPDGRRLVWVGRRWGWISADGRRSSLGSLPFEPRALVVHPAKGRAGTVLAAVTRDQGLIVARLSGDQVETGAWTSLHGALSVVASRPEATFFVGMESGGLVQATLARGGVSTLAVLPREGEHDETPVPLQFLVPWGDAEMMLGGGDFPELKLLLDTEELKVRSVGSVTSPVAGVHLLAAEGATALLHGREPSFALLQRRREDFFACRLPGLPAHGVSSIALAGTDEEGRSRAAAGYRDGRVLLATVRLDGLPALVRRGSSAPGLGEVAALGSIDEHTLLAVDVSFRAALYDLRDGSILRAGPWEAL